MVDKTRGNAAICIEAVGDPDRAFELACELVEELADFACDMTNPGVVTRAQLAVVTFAPRRPDLRLDEANALTRRMVERLIADGYAMVTTTQIGDRVVLRFCLIHPDARLEAVAETLWEENIRKYHRSHQDQLLAFLVRLHRHRQVTRGQLQVRVITDDPDDNAVLACAMEGGAAYIVTGDRDLLNLGVYEGIKIVTPAQFLRTLTEHQD